MITTLLVDDDYLVRAYLRSVIDWAAEGFDLYLDVCNGAEALDAIRESAPDLMIVDIAMPVMDGIELIKSVRDMRIDTQILVLSCHDEYEYVMEAMKLGAREYVLKHLITPDSLRTYLRDIKAAIESKRRASIENTALHELAQKGKQQLRRDLVRQLLDKEYSTDEQLNLLRTHEVAGLYRSAAMIAVSLGEYEDKEKALEACMSVAEDCDCDMIECDDMLYLFADFTKIASQSERQRKLWRVGEEITRVLKKEFGFDPLVALSAILSGDGNLTRLLRQVNEAILNGFYGIRFNHYASMQPFATAMPQGAQTLIRCYAEPYTGSEEKARLYLDVLVECVSKHVHPDLVKKWVWWLDDMGQTAREAQPLNDIDACKRRLDAYMDDWKALMDMPLSQTSHPSIISCIAYVREHYNKPITLNQAADAVGLNSSYLSHLFTKETGVRFSDYLQKYRIDAVKRFLCSTNQSVHQIAVSCGFGDYQYFCRVFKKYTGLRPLEFRKQFKKSHS